MRSMTGFGAADVAVASGRITAEVRSVNHRFFDARVMLPREFARWEGEIRDQMRKVAARGRVELVVTRTTSGAAKRYRVEIQKEVARAYVEALRKLKRELRLSGEVDVSVLRSASDIVSITEVPTDSQREITSVRRAVQQALGDLSKDRQREGAYLGRDMKKRVRHLEQLTKRLQRTLPKVIEGLKRRAADRMRRIAGDVEVDSQRILQEAAVLAERADVTEEIVRLGSHLTTLSSLLDAVGPIGKRIEFLLQELHREINTIGSKIGDLRIAELVLQAKAELEKLREQSQNVE